MKATYIFALFAALAVSANAWQPAVKDSSIQKQEMNGNNGVYSSSDGSLVGVPGAVQGGVKVLNDENNVVEGEQNAKQ